MHGDNPAGRLLAVLEKVKVEKRDISARAVWMKVLRVPENDLPQLLTKMGTLMGLPFQAVEELKENYPRQFESGAHFHFYSSVTHAFSQLDFNAQIAQFQSQVDGNAMSYLSAMVDLLEAKKSTNPLTGEEVADLQSKVWELMDFIRSADISTELKQYLLEKLTRAIEAIDRYFITGSGPIVDAIESTLGHAAFNEEYLSNLKSPAWRAFTNGLATIANIATIASGVSGLAEGTIMFIEEIAN